jgi:hypothetical protein
MIALLVSVGIFARRSPGIRSRKEPPRILMSFSQPFTRRSARCLAVLSAALMLSTLPLHGQTPLESQKEKPQEGAQSAAQAAPVRLACFRR